jgi:riboflavin kinase/FMN adenylyltransferase
VNVRVVSGLEGVDAAPAGGRAVAIGVFDGVHLGHQRIVGRAVAAASACGGCSTVVTFYPHPEVVLRPRSAPRALTSPVRKAELLGALGVEEVVTVKFDRQFAQLSPEAFCRVVLSDRLATRVVFVGENFHFGRDGSGTPADLAAYGSAHGFQVRSVPLVDDEGGPISSTRIRQLLKAGEVGRAAGLLGRPHRLDGPVESGAGRGRTLKAPTANLLVTRDTALPRLGVYATRSTVDRERTYRSVTSVGTNPTFETSRRVRVETLLLDYQGDLYGAHLAVDFLARIRAQRAFLDAGALADQIGRDVATAQEIHRRVEAGETVD